MSKDNADEQGYVVLITVLVLGAIVTVIVGFLLVTGQNASVTSNSVVANANAKSAATACAELALGAIQANPSLTTPNTATQTVNASVNESCTYTISGNSPNYTILATGQITQPSATFVHRLTITTSQVSPTITVSSWQDSQ